jgi:K+-transporting ATPase ATPase C chain
MNLRHHLRVSILMTLVTTALLGIAYPLAMTGAAQFLYPGKANGQLVERGGRVVGSRLIGQPFTSAHYFHGRPSAAGQGYDAANSGGTNLGPTSRQLIDRVAGAVAAARAENPSAMVPVDLVTTSASGLDPDLSPAAALFQVPRVARARGVAPQTLEAFVLARVEERQFAFLGEPRVNVLELNLALDRQWPTTRK